MGVSFSVNPSTVTGITVDIIVYSSWLLECLCQITNGSEAQAPNFSGIFRADLGYPCSKCGGDAVAGQWQLSVQ